MYTVIYRRGGYLNATWHKSTPQVELREAVERANGLERMGYKALVNKTALLTSFGLPIGYCAKCNSLTGQCTKRGKECAA